MTLMSASRKMLPTMQDFCTTIPLYEEFPLLEAHYLDVEKLAKRDFIIDCFCVGCDNDSVFISPEQSSHFSLNVIPHSDQVFMREFRCPRNTQHRIIFHFLVADQQLIKVGQHPSVADLSAADIRKYKKVLENDDFLELSRAVGLAAHGVGIGSFVYLRRIFERLINDAHAEAQKEAAWDSNAFTKARMDEKIELLKAFVPEFLVEQKQLYAILSKGIHSLAEQECLEAFPTVKLAIELILDERLTRKERDKKVKAAKDQMAALHKKAKAPTAE